MYIRFMPVAKRKLFFLVQRKDCTGILHVDVEVVELSFEGGRTAKVTWSGRVLWEESDG